MRLTGRSGPRPQRQNELCHDEKSTHTLISFISFIILISFLFLLEPFAHRTFRCLVYLIPCTTPRAQRPPRSSMQTPQSSHPSRPDSSVQERLTDVTLRLAPRHTHPSSHNLRIWLRAQSTDRSETVTFRNRRSSIYKRGAIGTRDMRGRVSVVTTVNSPPQHLSAMDTLAT